MQKIAFDKQFLDYEIYDDYGGCTLCQKEIVLLLKLIKKHQPELFEAIK